MPDVTMKIVILQNENPLDSIRWEKACKKSKHRIKHFKISVLSNSWLEKIQEINPHIILTKPGGISYFYKNVYDERLMILANELQYFCFPSFREVMFYENKKYLSYWLKANNIPHPSTVVFYNKCEALDWLKSASYPLVGKTNIGASGSGVQILKDKATAEKYILNAFSKKGLGRRVGPNLAKGGLLKRGIKYVCSPKSIMQKIKKYNVISSEIQQGFILLQKYVPHNFEWRVVRMGDSFFAHKKVKKGEKTSGSLIKEYATPPFELLDFVKNITDKHNLLSQAVDLFEGDSGYLINEMQCIFGQSDPYQMLINGEPGRYISKSGRWIFESGDFNTNESYDLRLETAINLYRNRH